MKKLVLLAFFGIASFGLSAQNFGIKNFTDTVHINGSTADLELIGHSYVENLTSSDINVLVVREENNFDTAWSGSYLCATLCWPPEVDSVQMTVKMGDSDNIDIHFMNDFKMGTGDILLTFQEADANWNPIAGTKTAIRYVGSSYAVSVPKINPSLIKFYPNPVRDRLNVELEGVSNDATVELYNIIGKRLASFSYMEHGSSFQIPVGNLPRGTYLLRVKESGSVITKKFQKVD